MSTSSSKPIFIHSLFRSGSTYLFEVFRRSQSGYWSYQEPDNEILLHFADDPTLLLNTTDSMNTVLRHPKLDKPYLAEFVPIGSEITKYFRKEFAYDSFFLSEKDDAPDLRSYFDMLIDRANGRPVLQCCRTTGRMKWIRRNFNAIHLFLWRNPWDQWWSYKVSSYFDMTNLMILNARLLPPAFQEIRRTVGFNEFHSDLINDEIVHFDSQNLDAPQNYFVFYALWLHAMHEGLETADVILSIDGLSSSVGYRQEKLEQLKKIGVTGLDLSDCTIHEGWFGEADSSFFHDIERRIHDIFRRHGYSEKRLDRIAQMREELAFFTSDKSVTDIPQMVKADLERVRQVVRNQESNISELKRTIINLRKEVARITINLEESNAKLDAIHNSLPWRTAAPFVKIYRKTRSLF